MPAVGFCACAKANRACTDCLPSKHRCCQNAPTPITASNIVSTDSASSSHPPYQHTSSFPDSHSYLCHNHCHSCLPLHYLQMQVTLIVEPSLHLIQLYLYHISLALGFKNKTCLFVLIASSWWLIHTIPLTFGNAHMPPQHLLFSPFSMFKGPTLLFPCPHLILSVNYRAVQSDTSL